MPSAHIKLVLGTDVLYVSKMEAFVLTVRRFGGLTVLTPATQDNHVEVATSELRP